MDLVIDNQIIFIAGCFFIGVLGTWFMLRCNCTRKGWYIADLMWVGLGGFGAVTALLAGVWQEDSSRLDRQIAVAFAVTRQFEHDAARFRLTFCDDAPLAQGTEDDVAMLCDKVEFLSASVSGNRQLPLFYEVARTPTPLEELGILLSVWGGRPHDDMEEAGMTPTGQGFDPMELLVFEARDMGTEEALQSLITFAKTASASDANAAYSARAGFIVIAQAYDELLAQVSGLKQEWDFLQENVLLLLLQIFALCLVAFAAPFRIGKSLVDLGNPPDLGDSAF
ncbi:hypothetical protein [Halocynthiibacter styelae]|uniref:Uncharacterized protein n=1 Tax=Halocynthiibacter styelae TaxID=2761955 RepID=A0A8J7IHV9_9RHOB|nr:hypothetical protein [Paenihalocynthiibacter styelae]MBI1492503.1 hypothetical protein [Paenihalocynthiibacter styelae]